MIYAIVVMGVAGCGKTTVGKALAAALDATFYDGDDFHPPQNIAKMSQGIPLDDDHRQGWLERLRDLISEHIEQNRSIVLACSALKKRYRNLLCEGNAGLRFVYLRGDFDLIWQRMHAREGHYMKADMLRSQFDALEEPSPQEAVIIRINQSPHNIIRDVINKLAIN